MVDTIQLQQNSFENKQQFEKDFPQIKCKHHQNSIYEAINLNSESNIVLACVNCIIQNKLNGEHLISIDKIFSKNSNEIILNWPPLKDIELQQQLNCINVQDNWKNELISNINQQFSKFRKEVIQIIEDQQKKILAHINSIDEQREHFIHEYNRISDRDKIQKILSDNQNNIKELESSLKNIISIKQNQLKQNDQKLRDCIDALTQSDQLFKFDNVELVIQQVLKILKQIDFSSLVNLSKQSLIMEDNTNNNELTQNVDKIVSLIYNRSNFCSQKFINSIYDVLNKNKEIFTHIDFNECFLEDHLPIQFEHLKYNEIEQLGHILESYANEKRDINSFHDNIQQSMQKNDRLSHNQTFLNFLSQYESKAIREIKKIPSHVQQIEFQNKEEVNLIIDINFFKSNCGEPDCISFKRIDMRHIEIQSIFYTKDLCAQLFVDKQILPHNKYEIQIEIKSQNKPKRMTIGLLPISQQNDPGWVNQLSLCSSDTKCGIDRIEKGAHISDIMEQVKILTFQISLSEKILRCITIVNDQKNINSLSDWNNIKQNEEYHFYINLYNNNQTILLNEFKVVKKFDKL